MVPIKIRKLHPNAVLPQYATPGASAFDLVAIEDCTIKPGETTLVKTGLAFSVPDGYELQVRPRSGMSLKTPLRVANSPGTVDADYRGEVCIIVTNSAPELNAFGGMNIFGGLTIKKGDRVAQGAICPVVRAEFEVAEELDNTQRGAGGFGSTGTN